MILDLAFRPDGKMLAAAGRDGRATVWDISDGRNVYTAEGLADVRTIAFSPDGQRFGIGTWPGYVKIFEFRGDGIHAIASQPRPASILDLDWRPDGRQIAVCTREEGVQVWNAQTFQRVRTFYGVSTRAAFSPDGRRLAIGGLDRQVRIWDLATQPQPHLVRPHPLGASIKEIAFSPDSRYLALTSIKETLPGSRNDHALKLWDVASRQIVREFKGHMGWLTGVAFSSDGNRLVTSSEDKTVKLWDVATGDEIRSFEGHTAAVLAVAFSPNDRHVVSASSDKTVKLWESDTGRELRTFEGHSAAVNCAQFHSDGAAIVSASANGWIRIWDVGSGEMLAEWRGHDKSVNDLACTRGNLFATCSDDHTIRLWEIEAARAGQTEPVRTLRGHTEPVASIGLSADGARLASVGFDWAVKIWNVPDGDELLSIRSNVANTSRMRFSPDGQLLAASFNYQLYLWDATDK
jgi:WD40 repeat protein